MNLIAKQKLFSQLLARLLWELRDKGYDITMGECYRPAETAKMYAKEGKGIVNSLHCMRLAADLNIFKNGMLLTRKEEYEEAGKIWESYATIEYETVWGGRFNDSDHFSIEHNGIK